MVAMSAGKGIAIVAEALADGNDSGATFCSPWFWLICRAKASCGKEAFLLKAFLVTFVATKVTRPSRGHERARFKSEEQYSFEAGISDLY